MNIMNSEYKFTDQGNAERFVLKNENIARYNHAIKKWMVYDGSCWINDDKGYVQNLAVESVKELLVAASRMTAMEDAKKICSWANSSLSSYRIESMLRLARSINPISQEELDNCPWKFNVSNGTIDLKTGQFKDHKQEDMISKISPVVYDCEASCNRWDDFLNVIMDEDDELIKYLQKVIGYSLTGITKEQCMFILFGNGANGKSTFINTIMHLMGDYATQTPTESLMVKRNESIRSDIARLHGMRFVSASEGERNQVLAESLIKQLSGGDKVTARFMYQDYFEFTPEFKVFLTTNYKPEVKGKDHGIWRRLRPIPFSVRIPERERDLELEDKLKEESSGILNWAIRGCLLWQEEGLFSPPVVLEELRKYRSEVDVISDFIESCCSIVSGEKVKKSVLHEHYVRFCSESETEPLSLRKFGKDLKERGFTDKAQSDANYWNNIRVTSNNGASGGMDQNK